MNQVARCPKDGVLAAPGTKFCPECGTAMSPARRGDLPAVWQADDGRQVLPECGAKVEVAPVAANCPKRGTPIKGAKFCPECGTKVG